MERIKLSEHFYLADLIQSNTAAKLKIREQFNPPVAVINNLSNLCIHILDPVKEQFGRVKIHSGYRCQKLNAHVGGVPNSQHISGHAVDISIAKDGHQPSGNDILFDWLKKRMFDQLIRYDTFIHISYKIGANRNMIIDQRKKK